jgi:hypothetical protein
LLSIGEIIVDRTTMIDPKISLHCKILEIIEACSLCPSFLYLKKYIDWAESIPIRRIDPKRLLIVISISIAPYSEREKIVVYRGRVKKETLFAKTAPNP